MKLLKILEKIKNFQVSYSGGFAIFDMLVWFYFVASFIRSMVSGW